ncbi:hypothetical protein ACFQGE_12045 [Halomicroarcula sp. GCM10025817]|uniref:hypothetical protein n=1 Tax=Haloarcula TaxID=2237 RepID=UPI0023E7ED89|nr:hypothetical protein [Halomicroarcula sp. SYNS111]
MNSTEIYEASSVKQLADLARSFQEGLEASYHYSSIGHGIDTLGHFVRESYLFRWLTAEPEPDVIVIDLRETVTVGPFLAVLERLVPVVGRAWESSRIQTLVGTTAQDFRTQPIRFVSLALVVALAVRTLLALVTATVTPLELSLRVAVLLLAVVGTQVRYSWAELTETRAYALAVALLAPPEIPADDDGMESEMSERQPRTR